MSKDIRLTYVSHACVRIDGSFGALLCDPWFLNEPVYNFTTWKYPLATMPVEDVTAGITHVFISHTHEDHFHIPSLDHLPRDVQLLLPEYSWHPGLRAQTMERVVRRMGFYNIYKALPWDEYRLDDETVLTFVPAAASKPQDWENCALVFDSPDLRLLNINDCPSDEESFSRLAGKYDRFDVALLQYAGVSMYPGRFRMTEQQMKDAVRKKRASFVEQARAIEMLNIDNIVPFAGDFCWLDDKMFHCNWACRATPKLFEDWHASNYGDLDQHLMIMYPGDSWSRRDGLSSRHPGIDWDNYLDDLRDVQARYRPKVDALNDWFANSSTDDLEDRTRTFLQNMQRHAAREHIDFSASIKFMVAGDSTSLSFALLASPEEGFRTIYGFNQDTDHTCHLSEAQWASVLAGKIMFNTLHWTSEIEQREPFNPDVGRFWWWLEYYGDLNNRPPQVLINDVQFPEAGRRADPQFGVFGAT